MIPIAVSDRNTLLGKKFKTQIDRALVLVLQDMGTGSSKTSSTPGKHQKVFASWTDF